MKRKIGFYTVSLEILMLLLFSFLNAEVIPTNEWVNFFSSNTTFDGKPIPVGSTINAYDPDGILCGSFTIHTTGQYGFLIVYKDDFTTPEIDEGADPGNTITFYINEHLALPLGPDDPIWTSNGDLINIDLEGHSNYDPVITSTPDTTAMEDELYSYTVTATDIDEDNLNYSLIVQPSWLSINSVTGIISGIPTNDNVGDTLVSVKVEDGYGGENAQTYTLHVSNANDPPVITTTNLPDAIEDVAYSEVIEAYDLDTGDVINFSLLVYPSWLSINSATGILSGTPPNDDVGDNIQIKVMVSDLLGASDTLNTFIDVYNINDPPVISEIFPDTIVFRSDTTHTIDLDNFVSDDDNPIAELTWSVSGNISVVVNIDATTHEAIFSAPHTFSGSENIAFWVTDDSLASDSDTVVVQVIPYIYSIDLFLNENWNLVSWDVNPANDSVDALFDDILSFMEVMLGFNSIGYTYDPIQPTFSNLFQTNHLNGYWIKTSTACNVSITGATVPNDTAIILDEGWNLISYLPDDPDSVMHTLDGIMENLVVVLGYNGGGLSCYPPYPDFNNLNILSPGYGYWLKLSERDTLIYPENTVAPGAGLSKATLFTSQRKILSPTNEWINVFGKEIVHDNLLLKKGSTVEARDPDNVLCGEYIVSEEGKFGMMPVYRDDPRTEIDEGADPGDIISIFIDGNEINAKVTWDQFGAAHQIDLDNIETNIPDVFKLYPNFPNPFNPVTNIQFQLPCWSYVDLNIYDLRGFEVRKLVQQEMKPGLHMITWDGKDNLGKLMSSGVYFYAIRAGNYKHTRKMLFLR